MTKANVFYKTVFILLVSVTFLTSCKSQESMIDKTVVDNLDLGKYLGTWYEIARYDHRFERDMVGVTANYSLRPDGKIKVLNGGYENDFNGSYTEAIGKAKIPNPESDPAKLKVSFFLFFYGDYYVMELDKHYQWAIIGSSSDNYLWILSRNPQMDNELYQDLLNKITTRGYDLSSLIKVEQKVM